MSQNQGSSIENKDARNNPEVSLNVHYKEGLLFVSIREARCLKVTSGKVYAMSDISPGGTGSKNKKNIEQVTKYVDGTANPIFDESLKVSIKDFL